MSYPVYYVEAGDTLPHLFASFDGGTGASLTLTGLAAADIKIYKDGGVTQRSSTSGFTLLDTDGIDFDGITGIHGFSLDLSDNTDAGFYAVGSWYHVVVDSVTVDAQTVSFVAFAFRIVSATRGLAGTALPDAAADAAGGLPISDAGALDLDAKIGALTFTVAGDVDVNVQSIAGAAVNTASAQLGVNVVNFGGAAGNFASGIPDVNITQIEGADPTDTIRDSLVDDATRIDASALNSLSGSLGTLTDFGSGATIGGNLLDMAGATFSTTTDSLEALRNNLALQTTVLGIDTIVDTIATRLGTPSNLGSGSSVAANLVDIEALVDDITGDVGTALATFWTSPATLVDLVWDESLTAATHNVANSAGRRLRTLQTGGNYEGGAIWIDTVNGTAGTTADENGVVTNPVSTIADALTLAASTNLKRFEITTGSAITFAATMDGYILELNGSTLNLGSQSIDSASIRRAVVLSSTGTSVSATPAIFEQCSLGADGAVTLGPSVLFNCGIYAITFGSAGAFSLVDCQSAVPGASAPTIDMGSGLGATTLELRRWSGGLTLNNVETGDVVSIDAVSGGTITVNGTGGTVQVRGMVTVVDGSSGAVTIVQTQAINRAAINAEADTAISDWATSVLPDSVSSDGTRPTMQQAVYMIHQFLTEFEISGTTYTAKKVDGSTTLATFTLDDGTSPTSITRSG